MLKEEGIHFCNTVQVDVPCHIDGRTPDAKVFVGFHHVWVVGHGSWLGRMKVRNGDGLCLFGRSLSGRKLVDGMQYVRTIVPVPAPIADANRDVL